MALSREAYKALESIVGVENISEEPAVLDSYAFQQWAEIERHGSKFMPRPEAAILPKSTEEVQAIVKACNQYKLKVKTHSTGWTYEGAPTDPNKPGLSSFFRNSQNERATKL